MIKRTMRTTRILFTALGLLFNTAGCSSANSDASSSPKAGTRTTITDPLMAEAPGTLVLNDYSGTCKIDYSNTSEGYVFVTYTGSAAKVQIQITNPDGTVYPYPLKLNSAEDFPLTGGDGTYQINVFEQISGDNYAVCLSGSFSVTLNDEFRPYLYPSQYINYTKDSSCVQLGIQLSGECDTDIEYIGKVYDYVTTNITYDQEMASDPPANYIPDPDATLECKTGICFDYASLMCAMLRSQGIPTKLQVGYTSQVYHAWISVYLEGTGWVDGVIKFDGKTWTLMDPTLGSYEAGSDVASYTKNGTNYYVQYNY